MTLLDQITPVILTFNEEPNIGRCLDRLSWAREIIVVDSGSDDRTKLICTSRPEVRFFNRPFDSHASQWTYAVKETGIATPWVLALDADYIAPEAALKEISELRPDPATCGYSVPFRYAILGRPLRSGVYPPVVALYRRDKAKYVQDGHTQRVEIDGSVLKLRSRFIHDDQKSLARWTRSQINYSQLEADRLVGRVKGLKGALRAYTPLSPTLVWLYCLFVRGGIFEGRAGRFYALQRMTAEGLICAAYADAVLRRKRLGT
jgi:Glycosyl transferase family 2